MSPASLLPTVDGRVVGVGGQRLVTRNTPFPNFNLIFSVDGPLFSGNVICNDFNILKSRKLPPIAQPSKLKCFALIHTCRLAKGQIVTIYTDSHRVYSVLHDFGALWHERGFITSTSTLVKNGQLIANLLPAILLPSHIVVIKCDAHTAGFNDDSWVNVPQYILTPASLQHICFKNGSFS